ncbi:Protein of unknown function [Gryllus bimaculatus]|nr:Protein of unknown function [Gryllus bimaculatus]
MEEKRKVPRPPFTRNSAVKLSLPAALRTVHVKKDQQLFHYEAILCQMSRVLAKRTVHFQLSRVAVGARGVADDARVIPQMVAPHGIHVQHELPAPRVRHRDGRVRLHVQVAAVEQPGEGQRHVALPHHASDAYGFPGVRGLLAKRERGDLWPD